MKLKNKEQRSLWYKKIFYHLKSGQSLPESVRAAAVDVDSMYIYEELMSGLKLSDICSFSNMNYVFSKTEVSLLDIAEQTGNMKSICDVLSKMLKEQHLNNQRMIAAMIYPIIVLCMASVLLIMILTVVVPKIKPLFSSMKNTPLATKILVSLSEHLIVFWYVYLISFIIFIFIFLYIKYKTIYYKNIKKYFENIFMHIPYVKDIYILWFIERWIQVIYLSLRSRVTFSQALIFGYQSISNTYIRFQFKNVSILVSEGNSCSDSLNTLNVNLKNNIKDWIAVISSGEKTGTLEDVFEISYEYINSNLKEYFDQFQKIIEPLLIVFVGIMVMCICLAIILPMYQLTQSVQ